MPPPGSALSRPAPTGPLTAPMRGSWRRVLTIVAIAVVAFAIMSRSPSAVDDFTATMRRITVGHLPWLAVAALAQVVSLGFSAAAQRTLLIAGRIRMHFRTLYALTVASTAITMLVPVGAVPASGWLASQYRERDVPTTLAIWAVLAGGFAAAVSVLCLLLVGAAIANVTNEIALLAVGLFLVSGSAGFVAVVHRLDRVAAWLRPRHPGLARRVESATEFTQWRVGPRNGLVVLASSVANWLADAVCLAAVFALIDLRVPWGALLFAFAASQVAGSLAPLPGGLGAVEGGLVGALVATGMPAGHALAAAVVYRVVAYWGVALAGGIVLLVMTRRARAAARSQSDAPQPEHERVGNGHPAEDAKLPVVTSARPRPRA